ncbi:Hypothetical protein EUBREC_0610 [Agathobacter rectalis ATCC 33656]|uniref:Uncharacterized protein n=1 Tax=Agathobacter rectalis (strain ATCC 33656 / DSM 3377 / JCM 17463 / KCTC 5835 / VPI 0990) TaxID=515619 RepID=C4ZCP5_AGARV|nr:Hypothetical protein EUBREC_0610 [Agathobacter rectalis ATCC 33656]
MFVIINYYLLYFLYIFSKAGIERFIISHKIYQGCFGNFPS